MSRSRWALLYIPLWHAAVHLLALEFVRPNLLGPTVGALRLNGAYGVLAFQPDVRHYVALDLAIHTPAKGHL